ncbi:MAG TPA: TIGR03435 family protein [Acidobacteriaceae bacterium]
MNIKVAKLGGLTLAFLLAPCARSQAQKAPLSFEAASVRAAADGAQPGGFDFMRPGIQTVPHGLLNMTAPVLLYIVFAYDIKELSDVSGTLDKLPDWTKSRLFTIAARPEGQPTIDQLREMMRTLLAERFALKLHEVQKDGPLYRLVLIKPGVLGPKINPHPAGETCVTQPVDRMGGAPEAGKPQSLNCGVSFYHLPGHMIHIGMIDATLTDVSRILGDAQRLAGFSSGGVASRPTIDATGLSGTYDLTLEFHAAGDGPENSDDAGGLTLTGALEKQLGMRLEKGTGSVRKIVIDHISEPTGN